MLCFALVEITLSSYTAHAIFLKWAPDGEAEADGEDKMAYRVTMTVGDMGWVGLDLGCSTILPSYPVNFVKPPSA